MAPGTGWCDEKADSQKAPVAPESGPLETPRKNWLKRLSDPKPWESWHDRMSTRIGTVVERMDRFFGDERLEDDNRGTRIKLGIGPRYHQEDGASTVTDINARFALPNLEERFHLIVDDSFEADESDNVSNLSEAAKDSEPDTALRYILRQTDHRRLNADVGVRFSSPSQLFGRLRGRYTAPWTLWELRLTQTVYWFTEDGFVETSEMRWTRAMGPDWLLRFSTRLTWEETEDGVRPGQSVTVFKKLTQRRGYSFGVSGSWPETPHTREAVYRADFTYRQLLHSNWLFFEISPGVEFRQKHRYSTDPYIQFTVSIVFDEDL